MDSDMAKIGTHFIHGPVLQTIRDYDAMLAVLRDGRVFTTEEIDIRKSRAATVLEGFGLRPYQTEKQYNEWKAAQEAAEKQR